MRELQPAGRHRQSIGAGCHVARTNVLGDGNPMPGSDLAATGPCQHEGERHEHHDQHDG
jgi:hypothetical protein